MSGGQVGDHGVISGATGKIVVDNTEKMPDGKYVHHGVVRGTIDVGEAVTAQVDEATRQATPATIPLPICCTERCERC